MIARKQLVRSLLACTRAVAFVEFAYALPVVMALMLGGVEVSNYVTTKMRMSQIALIVADHAARLGSDSELAAKRIDESEINDVLTGGGLESGKLNLYQNGRIIISSLEVDSANTTSTTTKYKIGWQRCQGLKTHASGYGTVGTASGSNMSGMGPTGQQVTAPTSTSATMFVELYYEYTPIISSKYVPSLTMTEIASMPVRGARDLTAIDNVSSVSQHTCNKYTTT